MKINLFKQPNIHIMKVYVFVYFIVELDSQSNQLTSLDPSWFQLDFSVGIPQQKINAGAQTKRTQTKLKTNIQCYLFYPQQNSC